MHFHELTTKANKKSTRVGRGIAAGKGKTAGRGTKGQGARKSGGVRPGFEGGQMPLYMRIPKLRGFTSHRTRPTVIYTGELNDLGATVIDANVLAEKGLVANPYVAVKLVSKGEITKKLTVRLPGASASAVLALKNAGGSFEKTVQQKRSKTSVRTQKTKVTR